MVKNNVFAVLAAAVFALSPTFALAQDATVKKGSLEATGTGEPATVAQAAEESEGEFEPALGLLLLPAGGGVAAGLLLGNGNGDGDSTSTASSTTE